LTASAEALPSLFRYFMWASLMRQNFDSLLENDREAIASQDPFIYLSSKAGIFMTYWYGGLYVVIEGWQALKLTDPEIDELLESPNTALLKRFRNGAFHFQKKWLDARLSEFMGSSDSVAWVRRLTKAFNRYLTGAMKAKYGKVRAKAQRSKSQ
jgi:hypothetical protein